MRPYNNRPAPLPHQTWLREQKARLARAGAPHSLVLFSCYAWPDYQPGPHHRYVGALLERVERSVTGRLRPGEEPLLRLMINLPPRHGKSQQTTIDFPAWFLGRNPDFSVILAAYSDDLARDFAGKCRDIVASAEYRALGWFPPARGARAKDYWRIEGRRGSLKAVGRGSGVTGRGANLLIIDDPVKDAMEARSKTIQQATWDWYQSTARTRLAPNGAIVLIQTRWHKADLTGKLLAEEAMGGKTRWTRVVLPALARENDPLGRAPGEALWPQMYPVEALAELMQSEWWWPLFQQEPQDPAGSHFKRAWFDTVPADPGCLMYVRAWDCAAKVGETNDWTVGTLLGKGANAHRYVLDVVRERLVYPEAKVRIKQTAKTDPPGTILAIEDTSNGIALAQDLRADPQMGAYAIWNVPVVADKAVRAAPFASAAKAGLVHLVEGRWNLVWLDEVCEFPLGEYDDQVDSASLGNLQLFGPQPTLVPPLAEDEEPGDEGERLEKEARQRLSPELLAHIQRLTQHR